MVQGESITAFKNKKLTIVISAAATFVFDGMAHAESYDSPVGTFETGMNVTLATDYIYRGISQTQGKGTVQGSLDIGHETGLYVGIWGSNVDFGQGDDTSVEFNYYGGFAGDITDDIGFDVGWIKYEYPGDNGTGTVSETYASLSAYGFTLGAGYTYDPDSTLYTSLGYEYQLPYEVGLALHYGYWDGKDDDFYRTGKDNYSDWSIGLSKTLVGIDFGLTYTDTNIKNSDCRASTGKSGLCGADFVLSASKTF